MMGMVRISLNYLINIRNEKSIAQSMYGFVRRFFPKLFLLHAAATRKTYLFLRPSVCGFLHPQQ